jgi:AraC-like DNA-binding protein
LAADFGVPHFGACATTPQKAWLMGAVVHFSTDDISPRHRLAVWREALFQTEFNVDIEPVSDSPFRAQATVRTLPGLRLLSGRSSPASYQRNTRRVIRDEVVLSFGNAAHVWARPNGREATIETGDAFLLPCGDCARIQVGHAGQFTSVRLPRTALAGNVINLADAYCRRIPRDTPALVLLKRYLALLDDEAAALDDPDLQHSVVTHVYDLLAKTLGTTRDAAAIAEGRGVRAARLKMIRDDIARHLTDARLSVHTVASRHKVSPRYVQRLFDESGSTFTEYVMQERLERAHRLLSDPKLSDRPLTSIAFAVGFSDLSHFQRRFRRRYGAPPSELRAGMRANHPR